MKFSVLIANYNNGKYFKDCWESLQQQTEQDFEVIIVDDASTDNSLEIIKKVTHSDNRVKLYLNDINRGCGYTKHRCATLADAPIAGYLDPDDTLQPNAVEQMLYAHAAFPKASIVHSKYYLVDEKLKIKADGEAGMQIPEGESYLTYGKGVITHFVSFKTHAYKSSGGIHPKFRRAVDQDLYYKLEEHGSAIFLDKFLYNYRVTNQSISCNENQYKAEYWHLQAMKDAVQRRGIPNQSKFRYRLMQKEFEHIKKRMNIKTQERSYCKRYYFLFKLFSIDFRYQLRDKISCLLYPNKLFLN